MPEIRPTDCPKPIRAGAGLGMLAALLGASAAVLGLAVFAARDPDRPVPMLPDGKFVDRLAFVEEDVPVRDTRVYDTVSMFASLSVEPAAWSDVPAPTGVVEAAPVRSMALAPRLHNASLPRILMVVREPVRHLAAALPPTKPSGLSPVTLAAVIGQAASTEETDPQPIRLVGWTVPGSQHLPGRRDAAKVASLVGDRATAIGNGAADLVADGADAIGGAMSRVVETVRWR